MDLLIQFTIKAIQSLLLPIVAGLVCGVFVSWQAKRSLSRREFLDRVNFSLNIIRDGGLKIRTLMEKPGVEVFLNPEITKLVNRAANRTTKEDCLLPIKSSDDYWLCLNALLNEVSEKFSEGFLKQDMGCIASSDVYVMCLTCEVADNIRTRKVRTMLIKKSLLLDFPVEDPTVDFESHTTRIVTLRQIASVYQSGEMAHAFVEIELCV